MTDNHYALFAAIVRRALMDVRCKNQRNKESAREFLDAVFPSWQRELERHGRPRNEYTKRIRSDKRI